MWPTGHNSQILAHPATVDDFIWVADWTTDRLVKYDLNGRYILDIGGPGETHPPDGGSTSGLVSSWAQLTATHSAGRAEASIEEWIEKSLALERYP